MTNETNKVVAPTTLKKGEELKLTVFNAESVKAIEPLYRAVITLCRTEVTANKQKFNTYYAYLNRVDEDGVITDRSFLIEGVKKSVSRKVKIMNKELLSEIEHKDNREFPLMLLFDDTKIEYKCDWDRDTETHKPKVDKYGNKHKIMFIYSVSDMVSKPKTFTSINDEDDLPF